MKYFTFFIVTLFFMATSCTLDKTDYEAEINTVVPEYSDFKTVVSFESGVYKIDLEALNGTLYKGYNEIRLKILNTLSNKNLDHSDLHFSAVLTRADGTRSACPHSDSLSYNFTNGYFTGYSVFTDESIEGNWKIHIRFTDGDQTFSIDHDVIVYKQINKNLNMIAFTGNDSIQYIIALKAPQKPKVSENLLIAGIYQSAIHNPDEFPDGLSFSYFETDNYTLQLDPRMPEPSMGNHSSPNNQHLKQQVDGLYHGVVNYTMTGNWTLNFILINPNGKIIKGTEVSKDFTPGVEGAKSELFIDILF